MSQKNNFLGDLLSSAPSFFSQLIFGLLLAIVLRLIGATLAVSICLGVIGGFSLGLLTTANENNLESQTVASNDGIDAAMKYWLCFLLGFLFLGYSPLLSIFLGIIAGAGGGWIIAWWRSLETARTHISDEALGTSENLELSAKPTRKTIRKLSRRYRRKFGSKSGRNPFRFW